MHILAPHLQDPDLFLKFKAHQEAGNVDSVVDGDYTIFNYTADVNFGKNWDVYLRSARGIVFNNKTGRVAALPMPKFFNHNESDVANQPPAQLPNLPYVATIKYDGSLGIIWFDTVEQAWRVNTRGSFGSPQAIWAQNYLDAHPHLLASADTNLTYLVEIIFKDNQIVVEYLDEGLVFITAYNIHTGEEFPNSDAHKTLMSRATNIITGTPNELIELCKTLDVNNEGFVLRYSNGFRVKIKGAAYCAAHKLKDSLTFPNYIESFVANGMQANVVWQMLPKPFQTKAQEYEVEIRNMLAWFMESVGHIWQFAPMTSKKDFALYVNKYTPRLHSSLFELYKQYQKDSYNIDYFVLQQKFLLGYIRNPFDFRSVPRPINVVD